jgi:nucleoside-diphosphate-sugar epimerase
MNKILITGGNGFIGQYLSHYLAQKNYSIVQSYRQRPDVEADKLIGQPVAVGAIDAATDWHLALDNVDVVVHLAARVHVMQETHEDPLTAFREVNTHGTINLAKQAAAAGVKRFVYLSSIKVNGEQTEPGASFHADDTPNPLDPYAISKYEAEQQLMQLSQQTGLEVVIIRPPLVYGPGVKGNFKRLVSLVNKSLPLPLAGIRNARSLVSIQNICSLIAVCIHHPNAAGEVFLVSDGEDLSTSDLLIRLAKVLNKKSRLFYLPKSWLNVLTLAINRQAEFQRLFGSLQVDINKNDELLDWRPEVSVEKGLREAIE